MVLGNVAVEGIGSGLREHLNGCAAEPALLGGEIGGVDLDRLNHIRRWIEVRLAASGGVLHAGSIHLECIDVVRLSAGAYPISRLGCVVIESGGAVSGKARRHGDPSGG